MPTRLCFFPFDLFGGGSAAGVHLLADEFRTILADNRRETAPTRARAYQGQVKLREYEFTRTDDYADWRRTARDDVRKMLARGDRFVWVSGNHLGALPVYDALAGRGDVLVVQLDAHLDVHHFADTSPEPTHGNFLLHVDGPLPPLINIGHRELLLTPAHVRNYYRRVWSAAEIADDPRPALEDIRARVAAAGQVFLDIDCDVFDPAFFPAVTEPMPFGLSPLQALAFVQAAWCDRVAGIVVSEFEPGRDQHDRSLAIVTWLLEHLLLRWHE